MLSAHGLTCERGLRRLFSQLDFSLKEGQWLHVRGGNGSGKTSLLRILSGLTMPVEGEIRWEGVPVKQAGEAFRQNLLFLGHHAALKEELTALENLKICAYLDGQSLTDQGVLLALHRMGLRGREDLPVRFLSAGQKRRVLLTRLLTRQSKLWVLDEPFNALDVKAVDLLLELIREHLDKGGMAIITSHQELSMPSGKVLQL